MQYIRSHKAAFYAFLENKPDSPLFHPLVKRLFNGFYNLRPSLPKKSLCWDPSMVLPVVEAWGETSELPIRKIAAKLALLIGLSTGCRIIELASLHLDHINRCGEDFWDFTITKIVKTNKMDNKLLDLQNLRVYANKYNKEMCPIECFKLYEILTEGFRRTRYIFCSSIYPYKQISCQRIRNWFHEILAEGGIIPPKATGVQSVRSVVATNLFNSGVPMDKIIGAGRWASGCTFFKHYYKRSQNMDWAKFLANKQIIKKNLRVPPKKISAEDSLLNIFYRKNLQEKERHTPVAASAPFPENFRESSPRPASSPVSSNPQGLQDIPVQGGDNTQVITQLSEGTFETSIQEDFIPLQVHNVQVNLSDVNPIISLPSLQESVLPPIQDLDHTSSSQNLPVKGKKGSLTLQQGSLSPYKQKVKNAKKVLLQKIKANAKVRLNKVKPSMLKEYSASSRNFKPPTRTIQQRQPTRRGKKWRYFIEKNLSLLFRHMKIQKTTRKCPIRSGYWQSKFTNVSKPTRIMFTRFKDQRLRHAVIQSFSPSATTYDILPLHNISFRIEPEVYLEGINDFNLPHVLQPILTLFPEQVDIGLPIPDFRFVEPFAVGVFSPLIDHPYAINSSGIQFTHLIPRWLISFVHIMRTVLPRLSCIVGVATRTHIFISNVPVALLVDLVLANCQEELETIFHSQDNAEIILCPEQYVCHFQFLREYNKFHSGFRGFVSFCSLNLSL